MTTFYTTVARKLERYPNLPRTPLLFPASSFYKQPTKTLPGRIAQPYFDRDRFTDIAADCGGFVASFRWGGEYRYTSEQYVEWLSGFQPNWAAMMDFCCEKEIAATQGIVRQRQNQTTELANYFWQNFRDVPWVWVPTIQGWDVEDYVRHCQDMRSLIEEMRSRYGTDSAFRVGIGTLCARASNTQIQQVVEAVIKELKAPVHLWGVKLNFLKSESYRNLWQWIASVDSAAWDGLVGPRGRKFFEDNYKGRMVQRQYAWEIAWPKYQQKVNRAIGSGGQLSLLDLLEVD